MKKLFLAFALTGIVGAVSVNTVSAMAHSKAEACCGGDEKTKKDKKCSKDEKANCKSGTASADGKCSGADKKCCHSKDAKTTSSTENSDTKKTEVAK